LQFEETYNLAKILVSCHHWW